MREDTKIKRRILKTLKSLGLPENSKKCISDDFEVSVNGDIRHISGTESYRVIELHRFIQDELDNAALSSNGKLDITYPNMSQRVTDCIIQLTNGANIDDEASSHLYGGSVENTDGTLYAGLQILSANIHSSYMIEQGNTSTTYQQINPDILNGVVDNILIKVTNGCKIKVSSRANGCYNVFTLTLGHGQNVAAI